MADGKDADFVFDSFVHDAVGFDDDLAEQVGIWREGFKAFRRNFHAEQREVCELGAE